jgi:hypothetical protein
MKMHRIALLVLVLIPLLSFGQGNVPVKVDLKMESNSQKLNVQIVTADTSALFEIQIRDGRNKLRKSVVVKSNDPTKSSSIVISDLEYGKYSCVVKRGKTEVYRGEFVRDAYDEL